MKQEIKPQSQREFWHNLIGHPLLAVCNLLRLYKLGTWIHDKVFYFNHKHRPVDTFKEQVSKHTTPIIKVS